MVIFFLAYSVKSILRDHNHERPSVSIKHHIFLTEAATCQCNRTSHERPRLERPYFYGRWDGLSRQVLLHIKPSPKLNLSYNFKSYKQLQNHATSKTYGISLKLISFVSFSANCPGSEKCGFDDISSSSVQISQLTTIDFENGSDSRFVTRSLHALLQSG